MKNTRIEKITIDWERKQRFLLKFTDTDPREKNVNLKRSQRFGHTYENKLLNKYGVKAMLDELSY